MHDIVDGDGAPVATISLSENQVKQLQAGTAITVQWHTPRLLQSMLGMQAGAFELRQDEGGKIIVADAESLRRYAALQANIKRARGE
jgi:hypothetical protein